ncbi:MAG: hypothetical protein ABI193_02370 [Minicystis sp.]
MLKHLNIDEMVALIAPWVTNAKRKATFLSIPEIAGLHPKVAEVHDELLGAQPAPEQVSPALQKIIDEADAADALHDPLARAVSAGIEHDRAQCLAAEPPDTARAKQAEEVLAKLFPNGMSIINASLLAESGNTARIAALLKVEPAIGAFLQAIPVRGQTTLLATTQRWIAAGKTLGKLQRLREELEAMEATAPSGKAPINVVRGRWIRVVSLVLSNLELSDASAESIELIRGPVNKASERAAKRYGGEEDAAGGDGDATGKPGAPPAGGSETP